MPATAGRVRMPANNRVHSSAALQTHGIWQSAIGYDPYAPTNKEEKGDSSQLKTSGSEPDAENAYANFQGLLALARITGSNNDVDRGACKKCGRVGHLKFQCKNLVKIKDEFEEKDTGSIQLPISARLDKLKGNASKVDGKNMIDISVASDEDDDSESSDSDEDPEIERILAKRYGKKLGIEKVKSKTKRESDEDGSDTDSGKKKRGRSKNRRSRKESDDSDDSGEHRTNRRKEKRRKRSESSDEDEGRRRHRKSRKEKRKRRSYQSEGSDSERSEDSGRRHRHKSRRQVSSSDSDSSGSDGPRTGRKHKRAVGKKRRRHHGD